VEGVKDHRHVLNTELEIVNGLIHWIGQKVLDEDRVPTEVEDSSIHKLLLDVDNNVVRFE
jgi:hypothetical protein